jgi:uncharacterized protein YceK
MFREIALIVCVFCAAAQLSGCMTVIATARVSGTQAQASERCFDEGVEPGVTPPCSEYEIQHHLNGC